MPFEIPNEDDATYSAQSEVDSIDFQIILDSKKNTVWNGCEVTESSPRAMTVQVGTGNLIFESATTFTNISTAQTVTITAADSNNPRFTLIGVNSSGTISAINGTASAAPEFPTPVANIIVLAAIYIPANTTVINNNHIIDKRIINSKDRVVERLLIKDNDSTTLATITFDGTTVSIDKKLNFTEKYPQSVVLTDGATINWNFADGEDATVTLAGNRTLNKPTNGINGVPYTLRVTQDTTGSRKLTLAPEIGMGKFSQPSLSTKANTVDMLLFVKYGSNVAYMGLIKDVNL